MYSHLHIKKIKDVDTGGRPTPMEDPIRLESVLNNVGFNIEGKNPIQYPKREQIELLENQPKLNNHIDNRHTNKQTQ